jgi:hypothetical protein
MCKGVKNYKYNTVIELGSWFGKSTCFLLKNMKKKTNLYCFDKFQNVANSTYSFDSKSLIDSFYFTTPRFETFCRNISPFISKNKECFTIKYDVNKFIKILNNSFIIPDIIFIDAIKKKDILLKILNQIFENYKFVIVVGDDYVFESVKETVQNFIYKNNSIQFYITSESYLLTYQPINQNKIREFIDNNYSFDKKNEMYLYELILSKLSNNDSFPIISILQSNKIDINKIIEHDNTLYNYIIISIYQQDKTKLLYLKEYIDKNYKPQKIKNILGLDYEDYIKEKNLLY